MPHLLHTPSACLLALILAASCGCQSFPRLNKDPFAKIPVASKNDPIAEVVAMWEPAESVDENGRPVRGFNGRLMFFQHPQGTVTEFPQEGSKIPTTGVKVSANNPVRIHPQDKVQVFVFDDVGTELEQQRPVQVYTFTGEQLETFLGLTNLGAEHDLFIPYPRPGLYEAKCALAVKYTPAEGRPVRSKFSEVALAGTPRPRANPVVQQEIDHIEQVGHDRRQNPRESEALTLPSEGQLALQRDEARLKAMMDEFLRKQRGESQPEDYQPVHKVTHEQIHRPMKINDLRPLAAKDPVGDQPEAAELSERPGFTAARRHPLDD